MPCSLCSCPNAPCHNVLYLDFILSNLCLDIFWQGIGAEYRNTVGGIQFTVYTVYSVQCTAHGADYLQGRPGGYLY